MVVYTALLSRDLKIDTNDAKNPKITTLKPNLFNDVWMWHGVIARMDIFTVFQPARRLC